MKIVLKRALLSNRDGLYYPANQKLDAEYDGLFLWVIHPENREMKRRIASENIKEIIEIETKKPS